MKKVYLGVTVGHLTLTNIIKSKTESVTNRVKRLLEVLSSHSFNLYYIKVKTWYSMIFCPEKKHDNSDQHEVIPIPFNVEEVIHAT